MDSAVRWLEADILIRHHYTLPKFITLRDTGKYYMSLYPNKDNGTKDTLRSIAVEPNADCTFEMVPRAHGREITLKGANGNFVF